MSDLFDHPVLCTQCNQLMHRENTLQEGFPLRLWECSPCSTRVFHPGDLQDYQAYQRLHQQQFQVKLRRVGNSFCVSIPKELIDYHQERKFQQVVRLHLEHPGKINVIFIQRSEA